MNRPIPFPAQTAATTELEALPTKWRRTRCPYSDPYVAGLNKEWARLAGGLELEPDVLSLLDQARRHASSLSSVDDLDDLVAAMHRHGDLPLLFAIEVAQAGSYVAARAIIQAMLPKLVRLTHSVREGRTFSSVIPEAIAAMYEVIYRYPRDRRPRSVAANLALDTLKSVRASLGPDLPASEALDVLATATVERPNRYSSAATPLVATSDELTAVLAEARRQGIVTSAEARLLWLVATGGSKAEVARSLGITPAALRQRYHRACAAIRECSGQLTN